MPDDKKRLFFALWPSDAARDAVVECTGDIVGRCGGRAVKPANLHITLAFLHNVETALIPCIEAAARRAAAEPFDLVLSQVGYWGRSRILWLAPETGRDNDNAPSAALADALWRELAVCGFTPEQRRYRPHVTLARKASRSAAGAAVASIVWPVRSFALVESVTGQRQSEYVVLKTFPLRVTAGISP